MYLVVFIIASLPFVLPIISLVRQSALRRKLIDLEGVVAEQHRTIERLTARLSKLSAPTAEAAPASKAAEKPLHMPAAAETPKPRVVSPPLIEWPPAASPDAPATPETPPSVVHVLNVPRDIVPPGPVTSPPADPTPPPHATPPPSRPSPPPAPRSQESPALPPPRPPTSQPQRPMPPPPPPAQTGFAGFDWEQLVGVRLFSAIAGIALVLAGVFFLRYSMDRGWLAPPVRVAIGIIVAIALLIVCERRAAQRYRVTANALDAAAVALLFATFFSAHVLWHLIPSAVTFGLLALVTVLAVLLSIRHDSIFIAALGLVGGFATPALLSTGENRPIPLFAYLLLLDIGLAWVAQRKKWPVLAILSLVLTTVYQWVWVGTFLTASQLPLAMGIFLACAVTAFGGLTFVRRTGEMEESVERASLLASAMPLGFAVFLAATPAYGAHAGLLFGFLFIVVAGLTTIAIAREHELLHAMSGVATVAVFAAWIATSYYRGAWVPAVPFLFAFVALFLLAPFIARRAGRAFGELGERGVYAAPLLLFVFLVIARVEPAAASPLGLFAMLFAALTMISGYALASGDAGPYLVASFFAVGAEAAWSATHFTPARVGTATVLYAVFALFHLGIPFALRRAARVIEPVWGPSAVVIASLVLMLFFADGARAAAGLWGFALLVGILNAGLFIESAAAGMSALAVLGGLLSWLVVGHWWRNAAPQVGPLSSLLMVVGLALIQLGGYAWTHVAGRRRQVSRTPLSEGLGKRYDVLLALASYVFFVATAIDERLVTPPWPLVGALLVVTLAMTATALAVALPALHAAAVAASAIVVLFLAKTLPDVPAIVGVAEGVIVYGLASLQPFGRRGSASETAWRGAAVALFVGELTLIVACSAGATDAIGLPLVIAVHVANLAAILTIAWLRRWSWIGVAAVAVAAFAWVAWQDRHAAPAEWGGVLLLASAMYLVFAAYPFALGARAGDTRDPYFTAIAGSIVFFFAARATLAYSPYASVVGIVPVGEAAVMALLVRQLLRIQPVADRDLGRLALVAATTLAFVTVAIPLQLQHQWITIGWALEGAALAWLFTRVPHKGLLYGLLALFAAVFVRLALNPAIFYYEPRGMRILNWYLYTYAVAAVSMFAATWWLRTTDDRVINAAPRASAVLPAAGVILLFVLLNIEVADFYATGPEVTFRFGVTLSQDLTYTIAWLVFGLLLLVAGISMRNRSARVSAVALIAVTTFKAFLYDLGSLGGLYRVGSLVGLAVSLSLVALALQKFVLAPKEPS